MSDFHSRPDPGAAPTAPLSVLILHVEAPLPAAAQRALAAAADLRIVAPGAFPAREAGTAAQHPDVVLLDVDARRADAQRLVREASARWQPAPLLVSTVSEDRACNRRLVRAGARGVVTHARHGEHLLAAIRRVRAGEIWLARSCMSELINSIVTDGQRPPPHLPSPAALARLTEREREVVALIARGLHNKAIAAQLGITDHTVRHHLTAIFAKLGVADRLELAVYAFRHQPGASGP